MSSVSQECGVSRSLTTRMDPVPGARSVNAARVIDTVRVVGLILVLITVSLARPGPATAGPRGTAIAVLLAISAAAWITWILSDGRDRLNAASRPFRPANPIRLAFPADPPQSPQPTIATTPMFHRCRHSGTNVPSLPFGSAYASRQHVAAEKTSN
jgi:hypothetical protein